MPQPECCPFCGSAMRATIWTPRTTIFECAECNHRVAKPTVASSKDRRLGGAAG